MIKIAIADDHALFSESLQEMLNATGKFNVLATFTNGLQLVEALQEITPDVVIMDIRMPEMNGRQATEIITQKYPSVRVLVVTMFGEPEYYHEMVNAGATGFILKESTADELIKALEEMVAYGSYFSQEILRRVILKKPKKVMKKEKAPHALSKRELEILTYVCKGWPNTRIAEKFFISPRTVEIHKAHIIEKTKCRNTVNLVLFALKNKLVEVDKDDE